MHRTSLHEAFVETGYFGYAVKGIAHRRPNGSYVPVLEVTNLGSDSKLKHYTYAQAFSDPDLECIT